ncbi:preprotein translocase subunit SecY [Candidatus Dependentiae bacterium]|nr:preprotein translocase subunit SecY [Candidatus Dependentiae bacterium]
MVLLKNFKNIFLIPELLKKILYTLGVLIIFRLGSYIPIIGINSSLLAEYMKRQTTLGGLLSYLDIFSGGSLQYCTLFALGIGPYITASIMMQLLSMSIPSLEALVKEGDYGRKIVNQYTRYLAAILSIGYSFAYALSLEGANAANPGLLLYTGWTFKFIFVLSMTVGSLFVMWLGEQISIYGIGSGSSMIIFAGIIAKFPEYIIRTIYSVQTGSLGITAAIFILLIFIFVAGCIVFLEKGERKIPVQYARRIIGNKIYGGQSTYIPFKINSAGIMPVIFANSVLNIPIFLITMLAGKFAIFQWFADALNRGLLYHALDFVLIIVFSFVYTAIQFNPVELADNLKKSGGFIPGIRPGKNTANFFDYLLVRLGLVGAIYLATLAVFPNLLNLIFSLPFPLGGTSLLIVVGVALETSAQIEAYLIENKYEGFLPSGARVKSRLAR